MSWSDFDLRQLRNMPVTKAIIIEKRKGERAASNRNRSQRQKLYNASDKGRRFVSDVSEGMFNDFCKLLGGK